MNLEKGGIFVDLEREVEKIYGKTRVNEAVELKKIYGKNEITDKNKGYLICNNCLGYYKLKENESPEDFKGCECGNPLKYSEDINNIRKFPISSSTTKLNSNYTKPSFEYNTLNDFNDEYYDEYAELQQIVDIIRTKAQERKKFLEKLYDKVRKQETILNNVNQEQIIEVKDNEWSLWELIEEKNIENDLNDQKMIIDEVIQQETRLLSHLKDKRSPNLSSVQSISSHFYLKIGVLTLIIALLSIIAIYAIK
jgi:hypothetical protein